MEQKRKPNPVKHVAEGMKKKSEQRKAENLGAIRTEASDTVQHSWIVLTCMNVLAILFPLLLPAAYVTFAVLTKLPLDGMTIAGGVVSVLACIALQSYTHGGLATALDRMAAGKNVRIGMLGEGMDDAGRVMLLYIASLVMLCVSVVPGAAVMYGATLMGGWLRYVVLAAGAVLALALLIFMMLRYSMSLFILVRDESCGAVAALRRSAKMMKGGKRRIVRILLPSVLIMIGMSAAMALLLWPLAVKRDVLTDALMYAGGVAYVIALVYMFMQAQCVLAIHHASKE